MVFVRILQFVSSVSTSKGAKEAMMHLVACIRQTFPAIEMLNLELTSISTSSTACDGSHQTSLLLSLWCTIKSWRLAFLFDFRRSIALWSITGDLRWLAISICTYRSMLVSIRSLTWWRIRGLWTWRWIRRLWARRWGVIILLIATVLATIRGRILVVSLLIPVVTCVFAALAIGSLLSWRRVRRRSLWSLRV